MHNLPSERLPHRHGHPAHREPVRSTNRPPHAELANLDPKSQASNSISLVCSTKASGSGSVGSVVRISRSTNWPCA